eukprot:evm.model.scf_330.4 EVM.evm.TU.scf_330.4   scf_330:38995-41358(-)
MQEGTSRAASGASSRDVSRQAWLTTRSGLRPLRAPPSLDVYYFYPSVSLIAASFFGFLWATRPAKASDQRLALWREQLADDLVVGCFWAYCDDLAEVADGEALELGVSGVAEGWYDPKLDYWSAAMRRCCTALGVRYQQQLRRQEFRERTGRVRRAELDYTPRDVAVALGYEVADDRCVLKVLVPALKATQLCHGMISIREFKQILRQALYADKEGVIGPKVRRLLCSSQVNEYLMSDSLQYDAQYRHVYYKMATKLMTDPWNTWESSSACYYGNMNEPPDSLRNAMALVRRNVEAWYDVYGMPFEGD